MNVKYVQIRKAAILSQILHDYLRPSATVCPKFYGLPEIHKPNVPLRPIPTSAQRQPSYVTVTDSNDINENSIPVKRLVAYSGESIRESYIAQFEINAQLNGWNYAQMAAYLSASLKGTALNVLGNLLLERRQDYHALVAALESTFGSTHRT